LQGEKKIKKFLPRGRLLSRFIGIGGGFAPTTPNYPALLRGAALEQLPPREEFFNTYTFNSTGGW